LTRWYIERDIVQNRERAIEPGFGILYLFGESNGP
jgi:hypothetical protein